MANSEYFKEKFVELNRSDLELDKILAALDNIRKTLKLGDERIKNVYDEEGNLIKQYDLLMTKRCRIHMKFLGFRYSDLFKEEDPALFCKRMSDALEFARSSWRKNHPLQKYSFAKKFIDKIRGKSVFELHPGLRLGLDSNGKTIIADKGDMTKFYLHHNCDVTSLDCTDLDDDGNVVLARKDLGREIAKLYAEKKKFDVIDIDQYGEKIKDVLRGALKIAKDECLIFITRSARDIRPKSAIRMGREISDFDGTPDLLHHFLVMRQICLEEGFDLNINILDGVRHFDSVYRFALEIKRVPVKYLAMNSLSHRSANVDDLGSNNLTDEEMNLCYEPRNMVTYTGTEEELEQLFSLEEKTTTEKELDEYDTFDEKLAVGG